MAVQVVDRSTEILSMVEVIGRSSKNRITAIIDPLFPGPISYNHRRNRTLGLSHGAHPVRGICSRALY